MDPVVMVAITGLGVAAINMIGSVLMLYIRAKYKWGSVSDSAQPNGQSGVPTNGGTPLSGKFRPPGVQPPG